MDDMIIKVFILCRFVLKKENIEVLVLVVELEEMIFRIRLVFYIL